MVGPSGNKDQYKIMVNSYTSVSSYMETAFHQKMKNGRSLVMAKMKEIVF